MAMPVVVTRDAAGTLHAFENRCAHRGSLLCITERGEARSIVCVYHNWSYDLAGNLTGVAFRRGLGGKGGMPADARPDEHPPRKLRVATIGGRPQDVQLSVINLANTLYAEAANSSFVRPEAGRHVVFSVRTSF